jgi:hypothetical protein
LPIVFTAELFQHHRREAASDDVRAFFLQFAADRLERAAREFFRMNEDTQDTYGIEPTPKSVPESSAPRMGKPIGEAPKVVPSGSAEPLPLEDDTPQSMRPIKDLDVCPNCGAAMGGTGEILCLRCGFDLKTMKQVNVQTGVVEVPAAGTAGETPESAPHDQRKPLVEPGRGDFMLPLGIAAAVGVIMFIAYMLGVRALFPPVVDADGDVIANGTITIGMRFLGVLEMIVSVAMLTACGLGALWFLAFLLSQRMGDWKLAAARMLGIVAVMQIALFVNMNTYSWERMTEFVIQAAIFSGLCIVFYRIKPKDTPTLLGSTVCLYLIVWFGSWVVSRLAG